MSAKDPRPGVLRIFQPARVVVRFLDQAVRVAQHAGDVADDRVDHHHGGHFAAVADEIADRDFARLQAPGECARRIPRSGRTAGASRRCCRQLLHQRLRQSFAGGREQDQLARLRLLGLHRFDRRQRPARGISTMPGPPPKGRSSTLWCLPVAQSRMFQRWIWTRPLLDGQLEQALRQVALRRSPGNRVSTSKRMRCDHGSASVPRLRSAQPSPGRLRRRAAAERLAAAASASFCSHFAMYFLMNTLPRVPTAWRRRSSST